MTANRALTRLTSLFVLLIVVALGAASAVPQAQTQPSSTPTPAVRPARASLPAAQYMPAHDYDQRNIRLNLSFDWERERAIGTATITFAPVVKNLSHVEFDAAFMTISGVASASGAPLKFEYDEAKEKLSVTLDRPYQPSEELTIVVSYHTNQPPPEKALAYGGLGLMFIRPHPDDPTRPKQIWTQGETEYNHYWFPSFDHPNDFVTSEIVATVEKPLSVISNGKLVETKENANGTRTFRWSSPTPLISCRSSWASTPQFLPTSPAFRS